MTTRYEVVARFWPTDKSIRPYIKMDAEDRESAYSIVNDLHQMFPENDFLRVSYFVHKIEMSAESVVPAKATPANRNCYSDFEVGWSWSLYCTKCGEPVQK